MESHWIVPLVAAIANVFLAVIVTRRGRRQTVGTVFTFLAAALVFWNLIYVVFYSVEDAALAADLASFFRAGALFLFPAVFHLCYAMPERRRSSALTVTLWIDYALAVFFVLSNALGLLVIEIQAVGWGYYSVGSRLYDLFSLYVVTNFAGAFALLIYELRTSGEPRVRLQLKFWLLALAVSLPLGLTNLLPVYGIEVYPIGNLGSAAWAGVVAYAIVRHRLMDVEQALTKAVAYAGVALALVVPGLILSLKMQEAAFGRVDQDFTAGLVVLLVGVGVLFPVVRGRVEKLVESSLFPEKKEARLMLADFARSLLKILDRELLMKELCSAISAGFDPETVAVYAVDPGGRSFNLVEGLGLRLADESFQGSDPFCQWLGGVREAVLVEEASDVSGERGAAEVFGRNGWHVCVPLTTGESLLGFVALGKKRTLDAFSVADLDALTGVAAQASVALENARLYDELQRSQEIINRADRLSALGTLAAGIAHEIRNPLVSIQTFFQLAPERLGDEEFMNSFLKTAEGEVVRIRDLVGELLSYAKSTSPTIRRVDVCDLVSRLEVLLLPHARNHKVELRCLADSSDVRVEADGDQLTQVFLNIALNGIHAAPEGGLVEIGVETGNDVPPGCCQIRFLDNGPGIPEDMRESIFNPFFTTKDSGTGLGLSIAHRIVQDCGGSIRVSEAPAGGSVFSVELPTVEASTAVSSERLAG